MKNKTIKILITLMIFSVISLNGCSKGKNNGEKVTIVLDWTPNTNHTGLFVAAEKGFFEQEGISVQIVQPSEDGAPLMVASGMADIGIDCQDTLAPAWDNENPLPVTAVAALLQHNTSGIISLKEKSIDRPSSLEGKKYSTWNNPVELQMMKYIVEKDGGDFNKVNLIPSTVYDVITALKSGDTDSVWIFYAWDGIATEKNNISTNFLRFSELNKVFDYYTPILIANNDFMSQKSETLKKALKAIKRGYEYSMEHPEEATKILLKAAPELDSEMVMKSQIWINRQYKSDSSQWGTINPQRWNDFYNWLYENSLTKSPLSEKNLFTNEYLDK